MNETKLIALDLDGTLLDEELHLSAPVRRAIQAAQAQGVHVTLATGRSTITARPFAEALGIQTPIIGYQGGQIADPLTGEVLLQHAMAEDLAHAAVERAEAEDLDLSLYSHDVVYFRQLRFPQVFYDRWFGLPIRHTPDLHAVVEAAPPMKFIIVAEPPEADEIEARWKEGFEGRLHIVRSHRLFVEGNPPGVSKGTALAWLARRLGIPQANVMAIGDNDNDITMVEWAGVGVAMGNGSPAVKAVADWVAPPVVEDGVAAALERFVLGRRVE
ncbi:MAG: HAD family phosphatase [Anaerolineae bacterium]|nr:HAD family phosphatase [Anaerolineae bacterium]